MNAESATPANPANAYWSGSRRSTRTTVISAPTPIAIQTASERSLPPAV